MRNPKNARAKRVRNLVSICSLIAIVLSASTYAWFVGMRTVSVSSFDIEIAGTDSLLLSLDGESWDTTVTISQSELTNVSYDGHTNSWGGAGLKPMSTIGKMDIDASRLVIFEKASLTATPGGYRLMSSRVDNYSLGEGDVRESEKDGYVVFDLFIRNSSGTQYISDYNILEEEAIYLTTNSAATVHSGGVENTGIENSLRVAFAQIGRVEGITTDPEKITGIKCTPLVGESENQKPTVVDGVTGICRDAQIWEPNDTKHEQNAINWYEVSCRERKVTGTNVRLPESFTANACGVVDDGFAYPTYAVKEEITSGDNVDVYDGAAYNKYEGTTKLYAYDYFTDTERDYKGTARPEFMFLAPNSITKVRIYVYIEGQDIDNYDFASIGKKVAINFGFTKERFTEEDIEYNGEPTNPGTDTTKPVITLKGDAEVSVTKGTPYNDGGATASDDIDGDITRWLKVINPVNVNAPGTYYITYNVSDWAGNYAEQVVRKVTVTQQP